MKNRMTKKGIGLIASLAMVTCLVAMPVQVHATGNQTQTNETFIDDAKDGVVSDKRVELTSPLTLNQDVTLTNVEFIGDSSIESNLITITAGTVNFNNVKVKVGSNSKSAIHVYGGEFNVKGLTVDHSAAKSGGALIINHSSQAKIEGEVKLTLGVNSWYGINVDNAKADFKGAKFDVTTSDENKTQSVLCVENTETVTLGDAIKCTKVITEKDGGESQRQIAYVLDDDLVDFVDAKTKDGKDISKITLLSDVELNKPLFLSEDMTVDGNGYKFVGTQKLGKENVVTLIDNGVTLNNVYIKTCSANKSGLHVYKVRATVNNLTVDNRETAGGAGIILNAGDLTVSGNLSLLLGENSWYGINADAGNGETKLTFNKDANVTVGTPEGVKKDAIYIEDVTADKPFVIVGEENVGLVTDKDGNYIVNTAPTIIAKDMELTVGDTFDPMKNVTATDEQDGDLTGKIKVVKNTVDTTKAGIYKVVYSVKDKHGLESETEITVTVKDVETVNMTLAAVINGKVIAGEDLVELMKLGGATNITVDDLTEKVEKGYALTKEEVAELEEVMKQFKDEELVFKGFFVDKDGKVKLDETYVFDKDTTVYMIFETKDGDMSVVPTPGDKEDKPVDTNKPSTKPTEKEETVKTDDENNMTLYASFAGLAFVGGAILVLTKKREDMMK